MRLSSALTLAATFAATAMLNVAHAVTIYAPDSLVNGSTSATPSDRLVMFDSANPAGWTVVGSLGVNNIGFGGMEFDAAGNLWGYASFYKSTGGAASGLYSINKATGAATLVGVEPREFLDDLAFNPADGKMYGIKTQNSQTYLRTVDLTTGELTTLGTFSGLPQRHNISGIAFDAAGSVYLLENRNDASNIPNNTDPSGLYKGAGLNVTLLYDLTSSEQFGLAGEQGIAIDWAGGTGGYHGATGRGDFPAYYSRLNTFATNGSGYTSGTSFGTGPLVNGFVFPALQLGDLAVMPVPEPSSAALLALGTLLRRRR